MKKFMLSCVAVLAVITIAGCSNSTVATTKGGKVTQEDLYESMKETAGPAALQKLILKDVLEENYGKDVTEKKINAEFDKQKKSYGEQFDTLLKQANLTEKSYIDTIRMNLLVESAVKANTKFTDDDYKKAWEDWTPKMTAQHILVADEAAAKDLIAKINALLRRTYDFTKNNSDVIEYNGLKLNLSNGTVEIGDEKIDLSKNEYKLLQRLLRDQGKIVTREQLLNFMWDDERFVDDNTLTVNINRLRTKITHFGLNNYIVTKVGQGYIIP